LNFIALTSVALPSQIDASTVQWHCEMQLLCGLQCLRLIVDAKMLISCQIEMCEQVHIWFDGYNTLRLHVQLHMGHMEVPKASAGCKLIFNCDVFVGSSLHPI